MTVALADLRLAAQQRCDRVNAATIPVSEWNSYINASLGALYRILTSTYEDYNVKSFSFSLVGGMPGNTLTVGAGSSVPDFDKIRKLSFVSGTTLAPVRRADSLLNFDELTLPSYNYGYMGLPALHYALYGQTLEVRPAPSAAGSYVMLYLPAFAKLVADTDTIDGTWMATNGIEEYVILDAAAKAMIKEESLDTANLLLQQREGLKAEILGQFAQRDDNMPGRILDVKRSRTRGHW